ncbi:unnamed protein product [Trichobilharzia regenti]|nr:unnamed protein product [Trichobilharzia regenti]
MEQHFNQFSEGDVQGNVHNCSMEKEEKRQGMAVNRHLEADRSEEHGEREDDSMQRWATEEKEEADFNVHFTGSRKR